MSHPVELTQSEAREVIAALSAEPAGTGSTSDERRLNVREQFEEAFGFENETTQEGLVDQAKDLLDDESKERVSLSDREAETVVEALSSFEGTTDTDQETVRDLHETFESEYDVHGGR